MEIFKELKKLGYIHYSATTIEELDALPLNSAERISEQALVLRWFREKHNIDGFIQIEPLNKKYGYVTYDREKGNYIESERKYKVEEAELACLIKLIEIVKEKSNEQD